VHRYGFNGKEKDAEGMGGGSSTYDYGFRIYNAGLGRFLSVDPLNRSFEMLSTYQFGSNSPVVNVDLDGLEAAHCELIRNDGKTDFRVVRIDLIKDILGVKYTPELSFHVNYNGDSYSFNRGLNSIGFDSDKDALEAFISNPDDKRWISDEVIEEMKDNIETVYSSFAFFKSDNDLATPKKKPPYTPSPERRLKTDSKGKAIVDEEASGTYHTQLGVDKKGRYPQRRTVDEKGNRVKDIDYHGGTDKDGNDIPNPHQHKYYEGGKRETSHDPVKND
jgi:RHS repeat-associated protein